MGFQPELVSENFTTALIVAVSAKVFERGAAT
jgi:hypothetical protein